MSNMQGKHIHITGIVQGVGFRPFVYGLATRLALTGWVRNTSAGVDIEVDGPPAALAAFTDALRQEAPPLSQIDTLDVTDRPANGFTAFDIVASQPVPGAFQPISPDMSICPDCLRELFDPADRRYRYPFINCTNCGPRFTIIEDIPYDRPLTTMAPFPMCPDCAAEYHNPLDRRFHAQPIACPVCGPQAWLENNPQSAIRNPQSAIIKAKELLACGQILAVKGLGGFHLACDATDGTAVAELRRRKLRVDKPFALMMPDVAAVTAHCFVSESEKELLESRERPIVILRRRPESPVAAACAPGQDTLGVMLPYTPLHYLLLEQEVGKEPQALVMTSGNLSEEPIAIDNEEARRRLAPLADAFLMHNRGIRTRCDDSVMRITDSLPTQSAISIPQSAIPIRRSRGYAPFPVKLPWEAPPLLATGAELKNTFCLTNSRYAFLSHHIGDLENYETLQSFEEGVTHLEQLFRVRPSILAYDLHPNYMASRYALARAEGEGLPAIGVQHHHAHVAACMAEHGLPGDRPVIGVAFDGTGYGDDGAVWGGEFMIADYAGYQRAAHLAYVPLPGGDKAAREPWRLALAWLHQIGLDWTAGLPPVDCGLRIADCGILKSEIRNPKSEILSALRHQLTTGLNAPWTSSMGRLFDAVAALAGVRQVVNYEAQAAIELETLVDAAALATCTPYPFALYDDIIDPAPLIAGVVADLQAGTAAATIATRFHAGVARMVLEVCRRLRQQMGQMAVALSGGVWQNVTLLAHTVQLLRDHNYTVYIHQQVPANDGGLALGQAIVAIQKMRNEG